MGKRGPKPKYSDQDYIDAITRFTSENGYPPTFRDLATVLGIESSGYHSGRIRRLHEAGLVRSTPGHSRSLIVINAKAAA